MVRYEKCGDVIERWEDTRRIERYKKDRKILEDYECKRTGVLRFYILVF